MRAWVGLFQTGQDPLAGFFGQGKVDRDRRNRIGVGKGMLNALIEHMDLLVIFVAIDG